MTYQLIYSSQATSPMSVSDLEGILVHARRDNARRGITGALVYVDGVFVQVLEGEKDAVLGLMDSIRRDPRHTSVTEFYQTELEEPIFGHFKMAFLSATPDQMAVWAGLDGTATIQDILAEIHREPERASHVAENILRALVP